jgi:glycosyltransferase involved in cell wall biosynthesis
VTDEAPQGLPEGASLSGEDHFGAGAAARHRYGVLYQGPWETSGDGANRAVRLHARALAGTGIPVLLKSFAHVVVKNGIAMPVIDSGVPGEIRDEVGDLVRAPIRETIPLIRHLVPRSAESLRQIVVPRSVIHEDVRALAALRESLMRANILFTVWERDRIPDEIARVLSRVGGCWVPCTQNAEALAEAGVRSERLHLVPHPFDPASRLAQEGPGRAPVAGKHFLSIGLWQPRKALHESLGAFLRTFEPDEATYTIKTPPTNWPGYPTPQESIRGWLEDERVRAKGWTTAALKGRVRLILSRLSDDEIVDLHLGSNIYLSASHGEGWGLPAFDAKVAGNRLVHVAWGGTTDFEGEGDVRIPYRMGPIHPSYPWDAGTQWAEYDVEALEQALRDVQPPSSHERPEWFDAAFSMEAVGRKMLRYVMQTAEEADPKAAAYLREQVGGR